MLDGIAVGVAAAAAVILFLTQCTMQAQLDEMQAEQRPWVSVEVKIGPKGLKNIRLAKLDAQVTLTNTGKTPALNVRLAILQLFTENNGQTEIKAMEKTCDALRNQRPIEMSGFVLFPGETVVLPKIVAGGLAKTPTISPYVLSDIAGCIDYMVSGDRKKTHQTRFVYEVATNSPTAEREALTFRKDYSPDQLFLDREDSDTPGHVAFLAD